MLKEWIFKKPSRIRTVLNLWPPFLFTGIKVMEISDDFRRCKVKLKNWPGTKNINGTQFGGSLFAMTDPLYSLLFLGVLGSRYYVWDKAAHIDFIKPGVGEVYVEVEIGDDLLKDVMENTKSGQKYFPEVKNIIYDKKHNIVAIITRTLYIRLKPSFRPNGESYSEVKNVTIDEELESKELAMREAGKMNLDAKEGKPDGDETKGKSEGAEESKGSEEPKDEDSTNAAEGKSDGEGEESKK